MSPFSTEGGQVPKRFVATAIALAVPLFALVGPAPAAAQTWSSPQRIAERVADDAVALAADSKGRVYAAWNRGDIVALSTWEGGSWSRPWPQGYVTRPGDGHPAVAASPDGEVLFAWQQEGEIYATIVGSFSVTNVSRSPTQDSSLPVAGWAPGLGFALFWSEEDPAAPDCITGNATAVWEAHLLNGVWYGPTPRVQRTPNPEVDTCADFKTTGAVTTSG